MLYKIDLCKKCGLYIVSLYCIFIRLHCNALQMLRFNQVFYTKV